MDPFGGSADTRRERKTDPSDRWTGRPNICDRSADTHTKGEDANSKFFNEMGTINIISELTIYVAFMAYRQGWSFGEFQQEG